MLDEPYADSNTRPTAAEVLDAEGEDDDELDRDDEEPPMTKEQLAEQSSNSVGNLNRL